MISILLFIASGIAIIGGIALFIFDVAPQLVSFWDSVRNAYETFTGLLPSCYLPFLLIPLALAGIGLLIKLL